MQKEDKYRELIRLQQESNLSVIEFCHNQGIAPATYYYWRKKLKQNECVKSQSGFIPLMVKENPSCLPVGNNNPIKPSAESLHFELTYPNGVVLRMKNDLDLMSLKALIHLQE